MEVDQEVSPETSKKKDLKGDTLAENTCSNTDSKKSDEEDKKPRIVLTFRSEKAGAKSSSMKIVPTEDKHDEVSPRRSGRTRYKMETDDEDEPTKKYKVSGNEEESQSETSNTPPKRSTHRRSKDFENVIANAIARKEKSYNEAAAPSRPSRRIKPSAKALENEAFRIALESQNNARLGVTEKSIEEGVRTRRSVRGRTVEETTKVDKKGTKSVEVVEIEDGENQAQVMKLKHLCELGLKAINTESADDSKSEDVEEIESISEEPEAIEIDDTGTEENEDEEIDDDTEVISKLLEADGESMSGVSDSDDEFLSTGVAKQGRRTRRSTRLHSNYDRTSPTPSTDDQGSARLRRSTRRHVDIDYRDFPAQNLTHHPKRLRSAATSEADVDEISEPCGAEEGSEATCPGDEAAIVATCTCEAPSNVCAAPTELTEPVFCQAIETVDGVRVGCSHRAARNKDGTYLPLARAGPRAPYFLACDLHTAQLRKHMCCPACGLFCSQGTFYQCSSGHLFHVECGLPYNEWKGKAGCPHCGFRPYGWQAVCKDTFLVKVTMHSSNKRIFLPEQREQVTPAYQTFSTLNPGQLAQEPVIPEDLLPSPPIDLRRLCERPDMEEDPIDAAEALCEAILTGETVEQLIPKIIAASNLNISLPTLNGGTVVHAAARRGHWAALHLLHTAGCDLDSTCPQRTPLMLAVLTLLDKSDAKSPKKSKTVSDKQSEDIEEQTKDEKEEEKDGNMEKSKAESETDRPKDEDLMKAIRYLVATGCDVNLPGPDGMTALHMAAQHGGASVCAILANAPGALVDPRDQGGWSPLVWAAENMHLDCVRYLLSIGADPTSTDNDGNSVIHWCALAGATAPLLLLLDAAPHAVHAVNANADTPLHVAAHQGHYACVIILLARGARTDVKNSDGELPMDVCEGKCQEAISLNMQMTLAITDKLAPKRLLASDLSHGREPYPVTCVNEVDDAGLPDDFTYVAENVVPKHIVVDDTLENMKGCTCKDDCSSDSCDCALLSVRRWWARGRLNPAFPYHDPPMLFQCNPTCHCHSKKCTNSVITRLLKTGSLFIRATVFRAGGARGWGLRTNSSVPKGAPVAAYVGELLTVADADSRAADQYMFALDVKSDLLEQCSEKTLLCVDAASYGGAARFMNHSCRPALAPVRVYTRSRDLRCPHVILFATRNLAAGDELTFDYGDKFWAVKSKWMRCECGEAECRFQNTTDDD